MQIRFYKRSYKIITNRYDTVSNACSALALAASTPLCSAVNEISFAHVFPSSGDFFSKSKNSASFWGWLESFYKKHAKNCEKLYIVSHSNNSLDCRLSNMGDGTGEFCSPSAESLDTSATTTAEHRCPVAGATILA